MMATVDIPAGAVPRDIEWYYTNPNAGAEVAAKVWSPEIFDLNTLLIENYAAATGVRISRTLVPGAKQVPYVAGSKLILIFISNHPVSEIIGARVGFTGGGAITIRDVPSRAYDSRTAAAGILAAGQTRTIGLLPSVAPSGTSAVVINLTAVGAASGGYLRAYAAHASAPVTSSLNFGQGTAVCNGMLVGVSSGRLLKVYASATVHVIIDVTGTVS